MRAKRILVELEQERLLELLAPVHGSRLKAAMFAVDALLAGGRLSLTALGRSTVGPVAPKHCIKRIDRLLGNRRFHQDFKHFFRAVASVVVARSGRPVVLVDWTKVCGGQHALVAAVAADGRSLPFYLEVHPDSQLGNRKVQGAFLDKLGDLLPAGCKPVIVSDAGFQCPWFEQVQAKGWSFVGRLSSHIHAQPNGQAQWTRVSKLYARAQEHTQDLGKCSLAKTNPLPSIRVLLGKRFVRNTKRPTQKRGFRGRSRGSVRTSERAKQPWVLATNLFDTSTAEVVRIYSMRMQIEESFRDIKNHRFGWSFEDARSRSAGRVAALLVIGMVATVIATGVGRAAEAAKLHHEYQANTVRHRRVLSHFVLGTGLISRGEVGALPGLSTVSLLGNLLKL